jgi:hypothetical protein
VKQWRSVHEDFIFTLDDPEFDTFHGENNFLRILFVFFLENIGWVLMKEISLLLLKTWKHFLTIEA